MTIDVPPTGAPRPFRWTCRLFYTAGSFGLFEGHRPMLIDGVLYEEGSEPPPHCCARGLTADVFYHAFAGCHLRQRLPLQLGEATDPVPDISVVRGGIRDYSTGHPTTAVFIVEVADFSLKFDTTTKAELYAAAGVPDYWVLDITHRQLHVFRDPDAKTYRTCLTLGPTDTVSPLAAPNATVTVSDLLP